MFLFFLSFSCFQCHLTFWALAQSGKWNRIFWDFFSPMRKSTYLTIFCKISFAILLSHFPMFGMFYAYAEDYKHNDCIFKDKTNLYNMYKIILKNLKKNTGLVGKILGCCAAWPGGEGASLALVGHPSSDGAIIKMPWRVDVLHWPAHWPALHPIVSYSAG